MTMTSNTHYNTIEQDELVKMMSSQLPLPNEEINGAVRIPGTKKPGYSSVYMNKACNGGSLVNSVHSSIKTLHDFFELSVSMYLKQDCLGERLYDHSTQSYEPKFTFQDYETVQRRKINIGSGILNFLEQNEFKLPQHDLDNFILTLYSENRLEWLLTDLTCQSYSFTDTSLYDTLGPETSSYILELTESPIVFCSGDKLDKLIKIKQENNLTYFIGVVCMDDILDLEYYKFHELGIELIEFPQLEKLGSQRVHDFKPPQPDTIYTISFTSGTTGMPKGVMLTHHIAVAGISFALIHLNKITCETQSKYALSFLPLPHILERQMSMVSLCRGIAVGFPLNNDPNLLIENLRILKPCYFTGVPRVFSRFESMIKAYLIDHDITDYFNKETCNILRHYMGFDNVEFVMSASAPINKLTLEFLAKCLDIGFTQLYGCTETYGAVCATSGYDYSGSSGPIGCTTEIKLKGMPQLTYNVDLANGEESAVPAGEILLRGPQVFPGYYKNPELSAELIDDENWFHTGDIGKIDEEGKIFIFDRVKNFFKLQNGEYIIPEKVENVYLSTNPMLTQLYVHGDPEKSYLIGIAGVNLKFVRSLLQQNDKMHEVLSLNDNELITRLNNSIELRKFILSSLNNDIVHSNLQKFEKLHNIFIDVEPLKLQDELLTPTLKLRRNKCKTIFKRHISKLYDEGSLVLRHKL